MSVIEDGDATPLAVIFGISGTKLTKDEKKFFKAVNPLGFILFVRNCEDPKQLDALIKSLHKCLGRKVPVLIDQEGGRVQRLKSPHWNGKHPSAQSFGDSFHNDSKEGLLALETAASFLAEELAENGFNVNCAPVLDVLYSETHDAIGDRAFSADPGIVAALGVKFAEESLKKGLIPVMKHIPGQGRAKTDSHKDLPVITASLEDMKKTDFVPFKALLGKSFSEAVWGMVAHVLYRDIDARSPASCSRKIIYDIIRKELGFQGLLLSDDIGEMDALKSLYGDVGAQAEKLLRAGCDIVLHCNGDLDDMKKVAKRTEKMTNDAVMRYNRSVAWVRRNMK